MVQFKTEEDSLLGNCGANMRGRSRTKATGTVFTPFCGTNTQS